MSGPNNMMVPCSKSPSIGGSGMGGGPPGSDPTQPLPPNSGYSKNSPIMGGAGPVTTDPNYAQQFHTFQQQLYATNTRSQGMGGPPGPGPLPPHRGATPPQMNNQNWLPSGPISK